MFDYVDNGLCDGLRIIENVMLVKHGNPIKVEKERTWKERLLTRPWNPFKRTKIITTVPEIPDDNIYRMADILIMHPNTAKKLREQINRNKSSL